MKTWLLDRALLILSAVGFVAAILVSSQWLGNENLYSAITAITIVALWFKVARLTKLLREHGIDPYQKRAKNKLRHRCIGSREPAATLHALRAARPHTFQPTARGASAGTEAKRVQGDLLRDNSIGPTSDLIRPRAIRAGAVLQRSAAETRPT